MSEQTHRSPPTPANLFVHADGEMAEYLCQAEPQGMTARRAQQLQELHDGHTRDCRILAAAELHLP
ncbi:hypothetical protein [Nocardia sp. NBC_01327]|uniref:hypothetical protein n=1 Tax=Nocardia sp. NBC_01327 TaxID=2903593 RepID=UPI002E14C950|nr:hypothetical protein OG326_21545 [Nocardia sp. NBC_01327]